MMMIATFAGLTLTATMTICPEQADPPVPPDTTARPHELVIHGDTRIDPYYWLRDRTNPEVIEYLTAENDYKDAVMAHTEQLQTQLYDEFLGRIQQTDLTVPVRDGDYEYFTQTVEGKQYPIHKRRPVGKPDGAEVLLDVNELASSHNYYRLGTMNVSPDHRIMAFSDDTSGAERFDLRFKDLTTGQMLDDVIPNTSWSVAWGNDNRTVFYTTRDQANRPYRIYRHVLGTPVSADELIYEEKDDKFGVGVQRTRSDQYIFMGMRSAVTDEVWYLDADTPGGEFRVIAPRRQDVEYSVDHHGDSFYIVTNDGATNFRLMRAPVSDPGRENWEQVIAERDDATLGSFMAFAAHFVLTERRNGLPVIRIMGTDGGGDHLIEFPEDSYSASPSGNPEFETDALRLRYTSLVTPSTVYDYHIGSQELELLKRQPVLGGYDASQYVTERLFATSHDGTKVPYSIVHRKGIAKSGDNPTLLYAYGSYGSNNDPRFDSGLLSLLDRGMVYATAQIRGGGEMGRAWKDDGKYLNKKNTFLDFIAVAEDLIKRGYTDTDHLAIRGGSAGGLLMGAVVNMRPELFKVVLAHVPFVDVVTTMLDDSIPLTAGEWEEWGDPRTQKYYEYMLSYSPYDNVLAKDYPAMLVTTGLNDPRVAYWEPAKWVAKLRDVKTDDNVLLLKTNMEAGHGGRSGRYEALRERAFEYAFLLDQLGLTAVEEEIEEAADGLKQGRRFID